MDRKLDQRSDTRNVLVVEDEYYLASDLTNAISAAGARVVGPVPTVADGLRAVASDSGIDAAVLDINLRGQMVFELAEALAARSIPFVFATGYGQEVIPRAFVHIRVFQKPIDAHEVVAVLLGRQVAQAS